ncbi:DUF2231 domain-containing protein [Phenylobacterium sp. J367]|uniref:DUF2231 domain-containing protein n=1 Tax=Phenylobacterium sp. J367 TaxID=2898435 RepID=UPI002150F7B4|nr:DUF2231 domain-containing protein [Phenylobacterium sp. J367]MCR5880666.1 hypothetical protein [Phenylobacterium sp. J367]
MRRPIGAVGAVLQAAYGLLMAFPIALFSFAVGTDVAYLRTAEMQWTNFSAWSITIGLVFGGLALIFALVALLAGLRTRARRARMLHAAALALMCLLGLINAFKHSQDAWSSVGAFGLVLSILTAIAALVAGAVAYSGAMNEETA